jgi:hypothetical protein
VAIAFWRGAVEMKGFVLRERGHSQDPPVVRITKGTLILAPETLFSGKVGGRVIVDGAEASIFKRRRFAGPKEAAEKADQEVRQKSAAAARWQDHWRDALPVRLTRIEIKNARINYLDRTHEPNVFVGVDRVHLVARDLQNRPKADGDLMPAKVDVDARIAESGILHLALQADPVGKPPRFHLQLALRDLSLPPFNTFMQAYANADVSKGTFELYAEIDARDGGYQGYLKPFFRDLDFRTASDENKGAVARLKEKVVSSVTSLLKNPGDQKVATKAPFSGNFSNNDVDFWTTVSNLLRNAFVQALREGLEGQTPRR